MDELEKLKQLAGVNNTPNTMNLDSNIMSSSQKAAHMKEHNIKPGSDAWFKLWFARPSITGESNI